MRRKKGTSMTAQQLQLHHSHEKTSSKGKLMYFSSVKFNKDDLAVPKINEDFSFM